MADETSGGRLEPDEEGLPEGLSDEGRIHRLLVLELGEEVANGFTLARATQERWARGRYPDEGLRERKKRRTRQQISDVATTLFIVRGFDNVRVAEIAEIVGVSEKTVYNYFPTKEALVFDRTDETIARLVAALRERAPDESPTRAMLRALGEDMDELVEMPDEIHVLLPVFDEMVAETPALRAAWLDLHSRIVDVASEELAAIAEVDPSDPEPMIAARAIVSLSDVAFQSQTRHIADGLRGGELRDAVMADLERAARMLDTGLWSFNLLTEGARTRQQLRDAARAAEDARTQVITALRQARAAWGEIRGAEREGMRSERDSVRRARRSERDELRRSARELGGAHTREAKRAASRLGEAAWRAAREAGASARESHAAAERAAYEEFRVRLEERREQAREGDPRGGAA